MDESIHDHLAQHDIGFRFRSGGVDMTVVARDGAWVCLVVGKLEKLSDHDPAKVFWQTDGWISNKVGEEARLQQSTEA